MKPPRTCEMVTLARQALEHCLTEVPFTHLEAITTSAVTPPDNGVDLIVRLRLPTGDRLLIVVVKMSGEPRHARDAINQIYRARERFPDAYGIFIAPYISPRSAALCTAEGVGYVDLAGNCRLAFDQIYIRQEGRPNPYAEKRPLRSLYTPKAERVLRVLLTHPARRWRVQEMADEADVSLGQVAKVKALLADREWIRTESEGFALCDPPALLTEWAANYRYRRSEIREFYSLQSVAEIESRLGNLARESAIRCALTGFSGAARLAPFVRYQRVTAYVGTEEGLETLIGKLNLKRVATGANVNLLLPYDEGVFYDVRDMEEVTVVTPVQCYLDVQSSPARGSEAAEAILRETLQPQWRAAA